MSRKDRFMLNNDTNIITAKGVDATYPAFQVLMAKTDELLAAKARSNEDYFPNRTSDQFEEDVADHMQKAARELNENWHIDLVRGHSFPDIEADIVEDPKRFGTEVKCTISNHWTSTGSSILESTRSECVKKIYLTFGKLGRPSDFRSKPYESCMADIAVTHYPRYRINMDLKDGETIFDKMHISYDELRLMENPVIPVSEYYRSKLRPGESLWWAGNNVDVESSMVVRAWSALSERERFVFKGQGLAMFPELVCKSNQTKYNRFALWLTTRNSVVNPNVRDVFSASGQVEMKTSDGIIVRMPRVFEHIAACADIIREYINQADINFLRECWGVSIMSENRIRQWCGIAADIKSKSEGKPIERKVVWKVLQRIFPEIGEREEYVIYEFPKNLLNDEMVIMSPRQN